ncbi:MAG: UDP-N-acetylglucosamine 1-carboxyvinyltransferase [Patescibacteria group bacterium]|jgi:UDP-N-acetylglucosamine 1-carboxyvinyltransferase
MSEQIKIVGGKPLKGTVKISGAKNEATKLMVASALFDTPLVMENVPDIDDVAITAELLHHLGSIIKFDKVRHTLVVDSTHINRHEAIFGEGRGNRLSILLAGPLLHRFGKCVVEKPGGCRIGERPLDLHLYYLRTLGITINEDDRLISLSGKLTGNVIEFPYKSVGATEGVLLASVYAKGETIIKNHANEPEVIELIKVLQQAGALIEYDSEGHIHVTGVDKPLKINVPIRVIGDRVEAVSYMAAALATDGEISLEGIDQNSIITALTMFRKAGADIKIEGQTILVKRGANLRPIDLETDPHPAFATDFQQVFAVMLSQAEGVSRIHETVFDKRFAYFEQLNLLGGKFEVKTECDPFKQCRFAGEYNHNATINGPVTFHGGHAQITDLRAAFALTMAGMLCKNQTTLDNASHLLRGYDQIITKLSALGADIKLIDK